MAKRNTNLLIAKHSSGKMIDIADSANGLNCDCTCSCCGDRLVAKQGNINEWHFAHESGADCAGSIESALHKAAKQIIQEEQLLYVDAYDPIMALMPNFYGLLTSTKNFINGLDTNPLKPSDFYQFASKDLVDRFLFTKANCNINKLKLSNVVSEIKAENSNLIPDITCSFEGSPLYIEIVVTHECDEDKRNKLKLLNVPTIEIHLSNFRRINFKLSDIREAIVNTGIYPGNLHSKIKRDWIVRPKYIRDAEFYAKQFIAAAKTKIDEIAKERAAKQAEIEARKTKIQAFGTTIVIRQMEYGLRVWIPYKEGDIFDELNKIFLSLGAKRKSDDWILKIKDGRTSLINELAKKDNERRKKLSELALKKDAEKAAEYARQLEAQDIALKKAEIENAKRREQWVKQRELELEQQEKDRQNLIEEQRLRAERKLIEDAKRKKFTEETLAKYSKIADHRWRLKKINDDLQAEGYPKVFNVT